MSRQERTLVLSHSLCKTFKEWGEVREIYTASCHCTAITTDLESYITIEAMTLDCIDDLTTQYLKLGFETLPVVSRRKENETTNSK